MGGGQPVAVESVATGRFAALPGYPQGVGIDGVAELVRNTDGSSIVQVQVVGLTANVKYGVHLHALPCSANGGGHYKISPIVEDTVESNEIWPGFTTDADGVGQAEVSAAHRVRGDAMSVVVHEPMTMEKMACADLIDSTAFSAAGTLAPFAGAEAGDQTIAGSAQMTVTASGTQVTLAATGLDPALEYMAHVHALPCSVNDAGGHYKIDPLIEDTVEENELWPVVTLDATGATNQVLNSPHVARADAQSVVIHRVVAPMMAPKVACADLTRDSYPTVTTQGTAVVLEAATAAGLGQLMATASMERTIAGSTNVELSASGLAANASYMVHVHERPCSVGDGGGHYKIDQSVAEVVQANEIWLMLDTAADGTASDSVQVPHLARAWAQSLVIHAAMGSDRLACIDFL